MPEGVIVGGWNFVLAAYAVVCSGLVLYAVYLITRLRSTRQQIAREGTEPESGRSSVRSAAAAPEPSPRHPATDTLEDSSR